MGSYFISGILVQLVIGLTDKVWIWFWNQTSKFREIRSISHYRKKPTKQNAVYPPQNKVQFCTIGISTSSSCSFVCMPVPFPLDTVLHPSQLTSFSKANWGRGRGRQRKRGRGEKKSVFPLKTAIQYGSSFSLCCIRCYIVSTWQVCS